MEVVQQALFRGLVEIESMVEWLVQSFKEAELVAYKRRKVNKTSNWLATKKME